MRIYIAGKITGDKDYRTKFNGWESTILRTGHEPINPASLRLPDSCAWEDYMKLCMDLLDLADAVCLLPDWKQSPGACIECGYALAKGKMVIAAADLCTLKGDAEKAGTKREGEQK